MRCADIAQDTMRASTSGVVGKMAYQAEWLITLNAEADTDLMSRSLTGCAPGSNQPLNGKSISGAEACDSVMSRTWNWSRARVKPPVKVPSLMTPSQLSYPPVRFSFRQQPQDGFQQR